jgi:hypothetical protein
VPINKKTKLKEIPQDNEIKASDKLLTPPTKTPITPAANQATATFEKNSATSFSLAVLSILFSAIPKIVARAIRN